MNYDFNLARKKLTSRLIRVLRKWHRRIGLFSAIFIIFLAITGIALNHTNNFNLASHHVNQSWLLDHYGIQTPNELHFYQSGKVQVTDNLVWLNAKLLAEVNTKVVGVSEFNRMLILITQQQLYLFDLSGQLIDRLDSSTGLPNDIKKVHFTDKELFVETGNGYFKTDQNMLSWVKITYIRKPDIQWLTPMSASEFVTKKEYNLFVNRAINQYRSQYLTWERLILDAHSGRLFSNAGVWFMDFIALLLIMLSASGFYVWFKQNNKK